MSAKPFVLWLVWQNTESRQRYHVGTLIHKRNKYFFVYEQSGKRTLGDAISDGYKPHLAFPDLNKTYVSNELFGPFSRRMPDKRRPDFRDILNDLGLSIDYSEMDLLRATGGRLATDSYEFVAPIEVQDSYFYFDFYIAGWRYYDGEKATNELSYNNEVRFELEPDNPKDGYAVIIYSKSGYKLGYIPFFYSEFMCEILKDNKEYKAKIKEFNLYAKPQLKVTISVAGTLTNEVKEIFIPANRQEFV